MKRGKNKRVSPRQTCLVLVEGKKGTAFAGTQTFDISKGGIGLISNRAIPLDEKIAVQIETAPKAEPILVLGKVVWVEKMNEDERYRIGLKFQKTFSSGAEQKLKRLSTVATND